MTGSVAIGDMLMSEHISGEQAFFCEDEHGNGCGRMFDGVTVKRIGGLCEMCAQELL